MARIVVVEDEEDLQEVLEYNLRQARHEVVRALTGKEGQRVVRSSGPDLVLLDLMLPDMAGTEVFKAMKRDAATRDIPVIMLTARGGEVDRVVGFELGADDYVVKPFSVRELLLRIDAVLRRTTRQTDASDTSKTVLAIGRLRVDSGAHRAFVDGKEVALTAIEFRLLETLMTRRDRVQTRAQLLDAVWGIEADLETRTVDTHVQRLREKLNGARDAVETVRGVGYRFVAALAGGAAE